MIGRTKKSFAVFVCFGYSDNNTHGIAHEILLHTRFIQIAVFQIKKEEDRHAAVSSDIFFHIIGFSAMLVRNAPLCSQSRYTSYRMIFPIKINATIQEWFKKKERLQKGSALPFLFIFLHTFQTVGQRWNNLLLS